MTLNKPGVIQCKAGVYSYRKKSGVVVNIYRVGRRWFVRKMFTAYSLDDLKKMHPNRPPASRGFPTRAMAYSQAEGNRAS